MASSDIQRWILSFPWDYYIFVYDRSSLLNMVTSKGVL